MGSIEMRSTGDGLGHDGRDEHDGRDGNAMVLKGSSRPVVFIVSPIAIIGLIASIVTKP